MQFFARPFLRSGWQMTVTTSSGLSIRACRVGTANSGVPMKMMRRGLFISSCPV
jgi:hypothetical protein